MAGSKWVSDGGAIPKICQECTWVPTYTEETTFYDCCQNPRDCALRKARRIKSERHKLCRNLSPQE